MRRPMKTATCRATTEGSEMLGDDVELILTLLALFGAFGGALAVLLRHFAREGSAGVDGKK